MNATPILFVCLCFTSHVSSSLGQCLSNNDISINETSVGSTVRKLIDGSLAFSLKLFRTLEVQERSNKNREGLFFSPFSIWSALMVTYIGARSQTETQLQKVLGIGDCSKKTTWDAYRNLLNWNTYRQETAKLQQKSYHMANKLYFQEGTIIKKCLKDIMNSELDFENFEDSETARSNINQWVEKTTRNKIQDLIPSGGINALTKMIIANAVYFKENWEVQFDSSKTKPRRFTLPSRRDILVNMMSVKGRFLYGISDELLCTGLELPYNGNDLSMLILLPTNRYYGVSILANRLTPDKLQNFLYDMYPREVLVSLPKFKLEDQFELGKTLNKMGLRTLFNSNQVDLSGFTGERNLTVDAVYHKSFVDVNEEGTEAAAATAVISSRTARPLNPATFAAEYPFVFLIRDNVANVILFMGTVQKPPEYKRNSRTPN